MSTTSTKSTKSMKSTSKAISWFRMALPPATLALLAACASTAPPELVTARTHYEQTRRGPAAAQVPAQVHIAHVALQAAERSFSDQGASQQTRDLAYIADRNALLANAQASTRIAALGRQSADKQLLKQETAIATHATLDLVRTQNQLGQTQLQLADAKHQKLVATDSADSEREARIDAEKKSAQAEQRVKDVELKLRELAGVKDEVRGLVITLSGSVLFASGQAALLPEAQTRLNQVADALMAVHERKITVEGHTDSKGSAAVNQSLSQRRADAVRSYLVSRGYDADLVTAQGLGPDRPIALNTTAEGRANNRRVEIVVSK